MSLMEHLQELRTRLIRAFIAIGIGFAVAYAFADPLFQALTWPIREVSGGKVMLIGTGVGEAFYTKIKVALIAGLFIASPAVFYEIWKFIAPGLYATERRIFLLGGRIQNWLRVFSRPVCEYRRHAHDSHQRVPRFFVQAFARVRTD